MRSGPGLGAVAHFLDRVVFCLFAEDVNLLPDRIFTRIVENAGAIPPSLASLGQLFAAMAKGGEFGLEIIRYSTATCSITPGAGVDGRGNRSGSRDTSGLDWSAVDPSIFGTLFERGLDPAKRSQLGAHYTSQEDIEMLVEPSSCDLPPGVGRVRRPSTTC